MGGLGATGWCCAVTIPLPLADLICDIGGLYTVTDLLCGLLFGEGLLFIIFGESIVCQA